MNLSDIISNYPDDESCKQKLKEIRDRSGVICPHCGHTEHFWKKDKECYECKKCRKRQSIRANTLMHGSQLPYRYWFIAFNLLILNKKKVSATELQRLLNHKYYQPIWSMFHKIRSFDNDQNKKDFSMHINELNKRFFIFGVEDEDKKIIYDDLKKKYSSDTKKNKTDKSKRIGNKDKKSRRKKSDIQ